MCAANQLMTVYNPHADLVPFCLSRPSQRRDRLENTRLQSHLRIVKLDAVPLWCSKAVQEMYKDSVLAFIEDWDLSWGLRNSDDQFLSMSCYAHAACIRFFACLYMSFCFTCDSLLFPFIGFVTQTVRYESMKLSCSALVTWFLNNFCWSRCYILNGMWPWEISTDSSPSLIIFLHFNTRSTASNSWWYIVKFCLMPRVPPKIASIVLILSQLQSTIMSWLVYHLSFWAYSQILFSFSVSCLRTGSLSTKSRFRPSFPQRPKEQAKVLNCSSTLKCPSFCRKNHR